MDTPKIPKGRYRARALSMELGFTSKGTEQVLIEFELRDQQWASERISAYRYFSEKTAERTLAELRICGWRSDDINDSTGLGENDVELVIDHEEYDGKLQARVQWINKLGGVGMKAPMSDEQRKAFAAKMRGLAVKSRSQQGGGDAAKSPDDIPF